MSMRISILLVLFICSFTSYGYDIDLYNQITENREDINRSYAIELSRLIKKYSLKFSIPPHVYAAILSAESDYRLYVSNDKTKDYGIAQINTYNIKAYKFSKWRLSKDLDYSIWAGAKVLSWFYKTYRSKGLEEVIKRYNCGTDKECTEWVSVNKYYKRVISRGAKE